MFVLAYTPAPALVIESIVLVFAATTFIVALLADAVNGFVMLALGATTLTVLIRLALFVYSSR